jgi:hypothetical protein
MKTVMHHALRAVIAALLLAGLWWLEAALCREQSARGHADQALAEADLLLARMAARAAEPG